MDHFAELPPIPADLVAPITILLRGGRRPLPVLAAGQLDLLKSHGIVPLLYDAISKGDEEPTSMQPALREAAIHAASMEPSRLASLRRFLSVATDAGVRVLLLKGSALAYSVYPQPEFRPRGDTDLYIAAGDFELLRAALLAHGYAEMMVSGDELGLRQRSFRMREENGSEHLYDVHWSLANSPVFDGMLSFEEAWASAVSLPAIGHGTRGLSLTHALILACVHRVAHHHDSERLIWLYDIFLLRQRMDPHAEGEFFSLASGRGVTLICRRSIERAIEWFGGRTLPSAAGEDVDARGSTFLNGSRRRGEVLWHDLAALSTSRLRLQRLRQLAFPPAAFMLETFGAQSRAVLPFLYFYRGLRGIFRLALPVRRLSSQKTRRRLP